MHQFIQNVVGVEGDGHCELHVDFTLFVLILHKSETMIVNIVSACFEQIMDSDRSNIL